jgi:predicted O-methyltransferase YrrM
MSQVVESERRVRDAAAAAYTGFSAALADYRERQGRRGESPAFRQAAERASFISGMVSRREAECLFELAAAVPAGCDIVEIGSYLGRSTAFLAQGATPDGRVHAVDPFVNGFLQRQHGERYNTFDQFERNMRMLHLDAVVTPHAMDSVRAAKEYDGRPIGLLFVDGDHSEGAVVADVVAWSAHLSKGGFVAFDDIKWTGVEAALRRLVQDRVIRPLAGKVGKVGVCGPADAWPSRVRVLARPNAYDDEPSRLNVKSFVHRQVLGEDRA